MFFAHTLKKIIVAFTLALLLNGCGATRPSTISDRSRGSMPDRQQPVPPPRPDVQDEQKIDAATHTTPTESIFADKKSTAVAEIKLDTADKEFVRLRLDEYEKKFAQWLYISETAYEGALADELTALEAECVNELDTILTGYSLLLERMQQRDIIPLDQNVLFSFKRMQQRDIAFLESRCSELLAMNIPIHHEFLPEAELELSFAAAQQAFATYLAQDNYQEAILAYNNLYHAFPDQALSLASQLDYGLALRYNGQIEAAARHFQNLLAKGAVAIDNISLQREIADLYLASGDIARAESYYNGVIQAQKSMVAEKKWAEEQLAFIHSNDPDSKDMAAYIKLLREFQMYDYKTYAPGLNEAINAFVREHAGSPAAAHGLRLKSFAGERLQAWFDGELRKVNALVVEKRFTEATDILKSMSRYYLPAELQTILQKTYYEVAQAESREVETQRQLHEMELTEQWDAAVNLLDSQSYDKAIAAFTEMIGTEYEEDAILKITEASNQAAGRMRKEAASLFIKAGKSADLEQKKLLLLASHRLLTEILVKYPQTDLRGKVEQNIAILEKQIQRFDPALLEELHQDNPSTLSGDNPVPYSQQLQ